MIKQQLTGETWAIGGKPEEIVPLHTALYNWQGIGNRKIGRNGKESQFDYNDEPLNLGSPETFLYFIVSKVKYLKARALAKLNCLNPIPALAIKGKDCMPAAKTEAEKEFGAITDEKFLDYCGLKEVQEICEIELAAD
jgi:hypothetical protein